MMRGTIKKLFCTSALLVLFSLASIYAGSRMAAAAPAPGATDNPLARQFLGDPGDGWVLAGVFLMIVALALASAGTLLWSRERRDY